MKYLNKIIHFLLIIKNELTKNRKGIRIDRFIDKCMGVISLMFYLFPPAYLWWIGSIIEAFIVLAVLLFRYEKELEYRRKVDKLSEQIDILSNKIDKMSNNKNHA